MPLTVDVTPPAVDVLSATQYLAQGGGGLVVFRARDASRVGVNVGGIFFPAYPAGDDGRLVSLIAVPYDFPTASPVAVIAQDEAGNSTARPVPVEIKPRTFPRDTIAISEAFLAQKLPELLPDRPAIAPDQFLPAFLVVNRDQRRAAEAKRREIAARTALSPPVGRRVRPAPQHQGVLELRGVADVRVPGQGRRHARCTWATTWPRSARARCPPATPARWPGSAR